MNSLCNIRSGFIFKMHIFFKLLKEFTLVVRSGKDENGKHCTGQCRSLATLILVKS